MAQIKIMKVDPSSGFLTQHDTANDDVIFKTVKGQDLTPQSRTNSPIVNNADFGSNIEALDSALGGDPSNTNYIDTASSVSGNLSALDGQVKTNADDITALEQGLRWINDVDWVTADNISAKNNLTAFSDYDGSIAITVGDRVWSTADNKIYVAADGSTWSVASDGNLQAKDTAFTQIDAIAASNNEDGGSAYTYNGSASVRLKQFDFETASSINVTSAYAASSGDPSNSDTVQAILQKLDGNVDNVNSVTGVSQSSTNLGTFTGSTLTDGSDVKTVLQDIEIAYEETDQNVDDLISLSGVAENATDLGTFTGSVIQDNRDIKNALQDVETKLEDVADNGIDLVTDGSNAISLGDLISISGADQGKPLDITANEEALGVADAAAAAGGNAFKALSDGEIISGILSSATPGTNYFWTGSGYTTNLSSFSSGDRIWKVATAKNATDAIIKIRFIMVKA